ELEISNPSKQNYRFKGWTAENLCESAEYKVGSLFNKWNGTSLAKTTTFINLSDVEGSTVTLKANWDNSAFGLMYDLNGGAGTIQGGDSTGKIGSNIKLAEIGNATKDGNTFAGWSINGVTPIGKSGETIQLTEVIASISDDKNIITFKAVWTTIQYTIEFRMTDKDPYMKITASYDVPASIGIPERTGYSFDGWKADSIRSSNAMISLDGSVWYSWADGKSVAKGGYVKNLTDKAGDTIRLTGTWTPLNYKLIYNTNGGTSAAPVDNNTYKVGDKLTLQPYDVLSGTYGSKIIRGWSLDRSATAPMTIEEFSISLAESANSVNMVTLYAVWVDGMCNVNIDLNGSKIDDIPSGWTQIADGIFNITVAYGTDVKTILSDWTEPFLDGHVFKKWNYELSTVTENMTITPEFEVVDQKVVYYFAAGAVGVISLLVIISKFEWL
ncbi:MAG: InlB B-repeat-containing protein, partial [Candidatus Methanomethylophilaceae archaeon]|nr:InlB B-repeat-containing protein [Candidatus Methanomethylophilaceae archaeon]